MELTPGTVVDDVACPLLSAVMSVSGCMTAPSLVHDPAWMCAAWALFGASPDMVTLTLSCPLLTFKSAVPDAACDGPEPCCKGTVTSLTPPLTSPHAIGENWSCGLSVGPLWTFTYHPVAGIDVTPSTVEVTFADPVALATTFSSGWITGEFDEQFPIPWMCAGCVLFGARPVSVIVTVSLLPASVSLASPRG